MSSQEPTSNEVLRAARDAGLLFEQEVASAIEALDPKWSVITNRGFGDPDISEKSREIDVWCHRSVDMSVPRAWFSASLVIECKHSETPFVFLTRPAQPFDGTRQPALWFPIKAYRVQTGQKTHQEKPALSRFDELRDLHWASTASVKGVYFGRMARKGSGWELVSEGMTNSIVFPLVKAMLNYQASHKQSSSSINPQLHVGLMFQFLVVVVDAPIYTIDGTSTDPKPTQVDHIRYARELSTRSIPSEIYSIDFVHRSHLELFVQDLVNPYLAGVAGFFERNPKALRDPSVNHSA
jgi:hypothetical protein